MVLKRQENANGMRDFGGRERLFDLRQLLRGELSGFGICVVFFYLLINLLGVEGLIGSLIKFANCNCAVTLLTEAVGLLINS